MATLVALTASVAANSTSDSYIGNTVQSLNQLYTLVALTASVAEIVTAISVVLHGHLISYVGITNCIIFSQYTGSIAQSLD